jgi:hypothetical protein
MAVVKNAVHFRTKRFNTTDVGPTFINPRCFGEDLGIWLASQLRGLGVTGDSLIQEDWGWSLPVSIEGRKFYINIGIMDEPTDPPEWLVWVEVRAGFLWRLLGRSDERQQRMLCDFLEQILSSDASMSCIEWSTE